MCLHSGGSLAQSRLIMHLAGASHTGRHDTITSDPCRLSGSSITEGIFQELECFLVFEDVARIQVL